VASHILGGRGITEAKKKQFAKQNLLQYGENPIFLQVNFPVHCQLKKSTKWLLSVH